MLWAFKLDRGLEVRREAYTFVALGAYLAGRLLKD